MREKAGLTAEEKEKSKSLRSITEKLRRNPLCRDTGLSRTNGRRTRDRCGECSLMGVVEMLVDENKELRELLGRFRAALLRADEENNALAQKVTRPSERVH